MFDSDNSIEPVRAVAAVAVTVDGRTSAHVLGEPMIREATSGELASTARRARSTPNPHPSPIQAVPNARRGFFRRRAAETDKPDAVAQQHGLYTAEKGGTRRYFLDYQQKQEVMRADAKRISTKLDDKQTVSAMLDLAQLRGWNTVRLKGTPDFQREAWVQAQLRNMTTEGYKPTSTDQQEAARRMAATAAIQAPSAPVAESKVLAGPARAGSGAVASKDAARTANNVAATASAGKAQVAPVKATAVQTSKPKAIPVQRSKAVWGAVEATGQQARAADAATAKATVGERPTVATME